MEDFKKELIEVRNRIDELIKQLGTETDVALSTEEPLENIIFNPKLFNTQEKLAKLKWILGKFIADNPTKDEVKINGNQKNQFFCMYAALWSRQYVLSKANMADFVRQMALWFPQWVPDDTDKKKFKNFNNALSSEQANWKDENGMLKVNEWTKFIKESGMKETKAKHFVRLAKKIYCSVNELVKEIQNE